MNRIALFLTLSLASMTAQAQSCAPKVMGGSGVNADASVTITGAAWMSWWCPSAKGPQLRIVASAGLADTVAGVQCFVRSPAGPTNTLAMCAKESINSPALKAVWWPDLARIQATRPK
jgi:hypothetical protein